MRGVRIPVSCSLKVRGNDNCHADSFSCGRKSKKFHVPPKTSVSFCIFLQRLEMKVSKRFVKSRKNKKG